MISVNHRAGGDCYQGRMIRHRTPWQFKSALSKAAHVLERGGLALTGASCALFVTAFAGRSEVLFALSATAVLTIIVYGALGFYLGIDLPYAPPDHKIHLPLRSDPYMHPDVVELLSAAGTFLAAIAAIVSVSGLILDEVADAYVAIPIWSAWALGATMQIAAGAIARRRIDQSEAL